MPNANLDQANGRERETSEGSRPPRRVGVIMALLFLVLAAGLAIKELVNPSGTARAQTPPVGMLAWQPSKAQDGEQGEAIQALIREQQQAGFVDARPSYFLVGRVVRHYRKSQDTLSPPPVEWSAVDLIDGRQIEVSSTRAQDISTASGLFMVYSKMERSSTTGSKYEITFPDGVTKIDVRVLKQEKDPNWPDDIAPRNPNWFPSLAAIVTGLLLYAFALAWSLKLRGA